MSPVSLTILLRASTARFPACINAESSTYHDLDTGVSLPSPVGTYTGCVLAARATEITMSATGTHFERALVGALACPVFLSVRAFRPHRQKDVESNPSCGYR